MSKIIAYAIQKTPKGVNRIKLGKSIEELKESKNPLDRMCVSQKTPNGNRLEHCCFHSHCSPKPVGLDSMYDYCLEGIKDYAICTDDYQVYDLCYLAEQAKREEYYKYCEEIKEKTLKYDHNMSITYRIHEEFTSNVERRRQMVNKKLELEKIYGEAEKIEESPEYSTLFQLLQKAQEGYESRRRNLEKIYNLKPYDISLDEFVNQCIKSDLEKVEKAKSNLNHWLNKNRKPLSKGQELIFGVDIQIKAMDKLLDSTYETPLVYLYKAIKALEELERYYKKDWKQKELYDKIYNDLEICNKYYKSYSEFLKDVDINVIISKVEKEQRDAAGEERKIKQSNYIQTAKSGTRGLIVKRDGTVVQDSSEEPKLIIGKMVTGRIEDEQWRNIRR